jgi:alkylhydroperoxidase/carboxymuconolactone decarboxylase family protein YurZ
MLESKEDRRMATQGESGALLDALVSMTADSMQRSSLDAQRLMLVRIAALAAVDAPPLSYLTNLEAAIDSGITADEVEAILIAVAPIIGTPKAVAAASKIARALGIRIAVEQSANADSGADD